MRAKLLGTFIVSILAINNAFAAPATGTANMGVTSTVPTALTLSGFNSVTDSTTLTALANPNSLVNTNIVDNADLQNFQVYTNYGGGITVTATNNVGNSQSPSAAAVLANSAGGPNIPYSINYTPCGGGAAVDLTSCTGSNGCTIPFANANATICGSTPGTGNYTFKQVGTQLGAGNYTGGTNLTFSSGL